MNADKTGLFWRLLPQNSLILPTEEYSGVKKSKERTTLLICCNKTGSAKKKLLLIAKSNNPRCFKNFDKESLHAYWPRQ